MMRFWYAGFVEVFDEEDVDVDVDGFVEEVELEVAFGLSIEGGGWKDCGGYNFSPPKRSGLRGKQLFVCNLERSGRR